MNAVFKAYLRRLVRKGRLEVETADGTVETFGDGTGPVLGVKLFDHAAEWRLMLNPALEPWRTLHGRTHRRHQGRSLRACWSSARAISPSSTGVPWVKALNKARMAFRGLHQRNDRQRARRNIAQHYDLNERLYGLFLDSDRQYSCAYFEYPGPIARRCANRQRSATSPPSSCRRTGRQRSTSAAGSEGLGFISQASRARA